jgi:hypothetical protein
VRETLYSPDLCNYTKISYNWKLDWYKLKQKKGKEQGQLRSDEIRYSIIFPILVRQALLEERL